MLPGRTRACPTCRLRFRPRECPACGRESLDLRRPADRQTLTEHLGRVTRDAGEGELGDIVAGYLRYGIPTVMGGAAVIGGVKDGTGGASFAFLFAGFAQFALVPLVAGAGAIYLRVRGPRAATPAAALTLFEEPEPSGTLFAGVVTRVRPVDAPLSHTPCAAFRLQGETAAGPVDEAGAGQFTLALDDGRFLDVDAREAQVRATVPPAGVVRADAALTRLLSDRALAPSAGPLRLAEAVVREGDRVWVRATPETATHSDGYRDADPSRLRASGPRIAIHQESPG